jgi:hypothetical protein
MNNYERFSQLCEGIVTEASTAMAEFSGPGAQEILKYLHTDQALGHDVNLKPVVRPKWADLGNNKGSWFLISGNKGFAAAKYDAGSYRNSGTYQLFASTGVPDPEEGNMIYSNHAYNATDANKFVKDHVGDTKKFYMVGSLYSSDLRSKRASNQPNDAKQRLIDKEILIKRFKPLFKKILIAARADVSGVVNSMIKNDAYDRAEKKIEHLKLLDRTLQNLENGEDIPELLRDAVGNSLIMTARYYYPKQTGKINTVYGYRSNALAPESSDGVKQVLIDIQSGDRQKLSAVLAYLKRSLI